MLYTPLNHELHLPQIVRINGSSAVLVEFQKCFVNHGLSPGIGLAADRHQELIEIHTSVVVLVKGIEEH